MYEWCHDCLRHLISSPVSLLQVSRLWACCAPPDSASSHHRTALRLILLILTAAVADVSLHGLIHRENWVWTENTHFIKINTHMLANQPIRLKPMACFTLWRHHMGCFQVNPLKNPWRSFHKTTHTALMSMQYISTEELSIRKRAAHCTTVMCLESWKPCTCLLFCEYILFISIILKP